VGEYPDSAEEHPNNAGLNADQLHAAIDCLYEAIGTLESAEKDLSSGVISAMDLPLKLGDGWFAVNRCRVYTESIGFIEELLIPAMGLIYDAKCMIESCINWKIGLTPSAYLNIVNAIRLAVIEGLQPALEELECWLCEAVG
jgi:hypothetical protein